MKKIRSIAFLFCTLISLINHTRAISCHAVHRAEAEDAIAKLSEDISVADLACACRFFDAAADRSAFSIDAQKSVLELFHQTGLLWQRIIETRRNPLARPTSLFNETYFKQLSEKSLALFAHYQKAGLDYAESLADIVSHNKISHTGLYNLVTAVKRQARTESLLAVKEYLLKQAAFRSEESEDLATKIVNFSDETNCFSEASRGILSQIIQSIASAALDGLVQADLQHASYNQTLFEKYLAVEKGISKLWLLMEERRESLYRAYGATLRKNFTESSPQLADVPTAS